MIRYREDLKDCKIHAYDKNGNINYLSANDLDGVKLVGYVESDNNNYLKVKLKDKRKFQVLGIDFDFVKGK